MTETSRLAAIVLALMIIVIIEDIAAANQNE